MGSFQPAAGLSQPTPRSDTGRLSSPGNVCGLDCLVCGLAERLLALSSGVRRAGKRPRTQDAASPAADPATIPG